MADVKYLEEKVEKATLKAQKCEKTIERHEKQLAKKIKIVVELGVDPENLEASKFSDGRGSKFYWEICDVQGKQSDIKGAIKKLDEAKKILSNWKEKLDLEVEKERFLEGNAPQVIKDFLETWKENAYKWYIARYDAFGVYRAKLDAEVREVEAQFTNEMSRIERDAILKEKGLNWKAVSAKNISFAGAVVLQMYTYSNKVERLEWLNKLLEADKKAKMLDLINRINKIVGAITDASNLTISPEGNLNGFIVGEKGRVKVATIGAGGYNIQVFHYRTLISKFPA